MTRRSEIEREINFYGVSSSAWRRDSVILEEGACDADIRILSFVPPSEGDLRLPVKMAENAADFEWL